MRRELGVKISNSEWRFRTKRPSYETSKERRVLGLS